MKQETQRRIRAYQKALPHMKERVMAVALLLVISISMMTSATFAWISLSSAPEVTGLATTISTNGNLEIALSDTDGLAPDDTKVGDGGQDVMKSNLTWGNLVNLSDPRYGLESITLRPAVLNAGSLDTAPLYSVSYGADGRVSGTISDFQFTNYGTKDGISAFYVPDDGNTDYGVRAVSSVVYSIEGEKQLVDQMNETMLRSYINARAAFQNLYGNKQYMSSITQLAGVYLSYRIFDSDQDCGNYIENIYFMVEEFHNTMEAVKKNLLDVANLQHYVYCNQNSKTYTAFTEADLLNGTMKTALKNEKFSTQALDTYTTMRTKFYGDGTTGAYYKIKAIYEEWDRIGDKVGWEELAGVGSTGGPINVMADIPSTTVNGVPASGIGRNNLGDVTGHDPNVCVVQKGLIKDMDQLLGTQLNVKVDQISVLIVNVKNVEVSTAAKAPWTLAEDNESARAAASGQLVAKNATAADTYGMAIDFWVRTNSKNSRLILEGEYIKETVVLTDAAGNPLLDDNGDPIEEERIVGYKGVNRVWEGDDQDLPEHLGLGTSATQGAGSCYVFYLENPEDQLQSLEMLKAMCVAFVDQNGDLLVTADLDTENVFEDGGRILVPLQARGRTIVTGQKPKLDADGNPVMENGEVVMENIEEVAHYITELDANQPKRITAIMYLDGSKLTNSEVLAAGSIKGQLNIQFGTTEDLISVNDPDQKGEYYNITLDVSQASGDFTKYDPNNKPVVDVTLTLNGMDASTIKGNFVSMVSTSQGAKQDPFVFTHQPGTATWTARVTLNGAGTYQLRSIQIDGVDYALTPEQIREEQIVIPGTTVNNISCTGWNDSDKFYYMSADPFYNLEITAEISGTRPRTVQGIFENEDRQNVTVTFSPNGEGRWKGTGMFTTSGEYDLTYMIIDGVRVPLLGTDYKHLELKLGMKTRVFMTQPVNAEYKALQEVSQALAADTVSLTAQQKTLANQVIAESSLSDSEKTALTDGVNGTLTSTQITSLQTLLNHKMEAVLDELYNGDPAVEDDGLQMTASSSGYSFFFNGGPGNELYMDVSCIITDDKDNLLTGLDGVKLEYQLGASATMMDSDMLWNGNSGYYEGQFQLFAPGTYAFERLIVGTNQINAASSAPVIAANSRDPMEYAGPGIKNVPVYQKISATPKRDMTVVLKHAPSATVKLTMEYTDTDASGRPLLETHELMADLSYSDNENSLYEYTVSVPKDGNWKIVGMQVANVVYLDDHGNKVYYDGVDPAENGTGWVDLSEEVLEDSITTEFFTTVIYSVNKQPDTLGYTGGFMEDHKVENMQIVLKDYLGRPVEGTNVTLKYEWNPTDAPFETASGVTYPNAKFEATKQNDGITFAMPAEMNFQLAGKYYINFAMDINGVEYTFAAFTKDKGSVELETDVPITVEWTDLPSITVTQISPEGKNFAIDEKASGTTEDAGDCDSAVTAPEHKNAGSHNYVASISADKKTATVFIECEKHTKAGDIHDCKPAEVTLTLETVTGVTRASLSFTCSTSTTVHLYEGYSNQGDYTNWDIDTHDQTSSFVWEEGSGEKMLYVGKVSGSYGSVSTSDNASDTKVAAGTLKSSKLTLTYGGINYVIPYSGITIINQY